MSKAEQLAKFIERVAPVPFRREMDEAASYIRRQDEAIRNFIRAVELDRHDVEDWPEDSREAFAKLREAQG
jgi:hypothetical protein